MSTMDDGLSEDELGTDDGVGNVDTDGVTDEGGSDEPLTSRDVESVEAESTADGIGGDIA